MKKMFKMYLKIILIVTIQFTFSSCDLLVNLFDTEQNSETKIRADMTVYSVEDAYVRENAASNNFGTIKSVDVRSRSGADKQGLIKFKIPNFVDNIEKAVLKIYIKNETTDGPMIYSTSNSWSENSVTWNNKPTSDKRIRNLYSVPSGWYTIDVTNHVYKNSTFSFLFKPDSSKPFSFSSREGVNKPHIIIQTDADNGGSGTTTTTDNNDNFGIGYFSTSSATTDLTYTDAIVFAREYKRLGYSHSIYNKEVTTYMLKYLLSTPIKMHYHSGHGSSGKLICTDGDLSVFDLRKNPIKAEYSIFATCSTLKFPGLDRLFTSNTKMIMGFSNTITDSSSLQMAKIFTKNLQNGETYLQAWYKANMAITRHKDRWVTWIREGSEIVRYSALYDEIPRYSFQGTPVVLSNKVTIDNILLNEWNNTIKFDRSFQVAAVDEMEIPLERNLPQDNLPTTRSSITAEQAKIKAVNELSNNRDKLPVEPELDTVIPIEKCDNQDSCYIVGYQVDFTQQHNGLRLRSNSEADYVSVLVNDNGVVSMNLLWSQVTPLDDTTIEKSSMLSAGKALTIAATSISDASRHPVIIVTYETVYGISTDVDTDDRTLVPAYEFIGEHGERFVVSAVTGELIK